MFDPTKHVLNLATSSGFDTRPYEVVLKIKEAIRSVVDRDTAMDTGTLDGGADLWAWFDGREYLISIKASGLQRKKELS